MIWHQNQACVWYDSEYEYYNLFVQTTINSPIYDPFLLNESQAFFDSESNLNLPNENIQDWQRYFGISYEQAHYLVFTASQNDVQELAKGNNSNDRNLSFIDANFKTKYKQALLYLAYAKYLEPYMAYKRDKDADTYYWGFLPEKTVGELNYSKVIGVLTNSWKAETDKDLKLRYGYQLVRFAHYYRKFDEAIKFFNQFVESLNYKPIMYYYALDQKGGAERALGNFMQANYDFFQFFSHTKNKKSVAYSSMKMTQDLNFESMLKNQLTNDEKFDLYMLMGYNSFNDPISGLKKIIAISPDAVQAKVLMARAVNQLERSMLPLGYYCPYDEETYNFQEDCFNDLKDKRLPIAPDTQILNFLHTTLSVSVDQTKNAKDKNFWNLTTSYLHFLNKDYLKSEEFLTKVDATDKTFGEQKQLFSMLLEIVKQEKVDEKFEKKLMTDFKSFFVNNSEKRVVADQFDDSYSYETHNTVLAFVLDILANRYFLQKDYAKSFLLLNPVTDLEFNPDLNLLSDIDSFYHKNSKNDFEDYLMSKINDNFQVAPQIKNDVVYNFDSWVANIRGTMALSKADFSNALNYFKLVDPKFSLRGGQISSHYDEENYKNITSFQKGIYNGFSNISNSVFGYNKIECFECPEDKVMKTSFLNEFSFIKPKMNKVELTEALIELDKIGKSNDEKAAKANYLMANFFFNTSTIGYFREISTFDINNSYWSKYYSEEVYNSDYNVFYYKDYYSNPHYTADFNLPKQYADAALSKTNSDELKAQILFTASKCEQGIFYQSAPTELNTENNDSWLDYSDDKTIALKVGKYRTYFKQLKNYSNTTFYKEVKSNCKYFNYYSSHY